MRHTNAPYNGKQFILNKSTGEIHDLDRESPLCCIDNIDPDHIFCLRYLCRGCIVFIRNRDQKKRMSSLYARTKLLLAISPCNQFPLTVIRGTGKPPLIIFIIRIRIPYRAGIFRGVKITFEHDTLCKFIR